MITKNLFDYYQQEGRSKHQIKTDFEHPFHRKRYAIIQELIKENKSGMLLDVGCAEGWICRWALQHVDSSVGIDISLPKLKRAKKEGKENRKDSRLDFILASFDYLPFRKGTFHVVVWSEGPEHALDPGPVFRCILEVLTSGGRVIITTMGLKPPRYYIFLRRLLGLWEQEIQDWRRWGHFSIFSPESLPKMLSRYFKVERELVIKPVFISPIKGFQLLTDKALGYLTDQPPSAWPGFGCLIVTAKRI